MVETKNSLKLKLVLYEFILLFVEKMMSDQNNKNAQGVNCHFLHHIANAQSFTSVQQHRLIKTSLCMSIASCHILEQTSSSTRHLQTL